MHYGRTLFSIDPGTLDVMDPQPAYVFKYYNRIGNFALSVGEQAGAAGLPARPPSLTNIVSATTDGGPGSLRAAIYYANDDPGTTVQFNIPATDSGFAMGFTPFRSAASCRRWFPMARLLTPPAEPGFSGRPIVALDSSRTHS